MRNAKLYFMFTVFLYLMLIIWGIKGPSANDPWELEWVLQVILFNILGFICLFMVGLFLKEDPTHKKIISRLLLVLPIFSFIVIWIVVGI